MLHRKAHSPEFGLAAGAGTMPVALSIVVPIYNEAGCIAELHTQLDRAAAPIGEPVEFVFIDDGSSDGSGAVLDALAAEDGRVTVAHFSRNFGKSAALDAAFRIARGSIVITLDADLQDDPAEIPRFLARLAEGFDVVSGWKRKRADSLDRRIPSLFFNWFTRKVSGVALHDFNCGFKAYRRETLATLRLYGELHRYIPVLLHWEGFRIGEIEVNHRARFAGSSKFGARRFVTGAFDLLTVMLTSKFRSRPLHFFGYPAAVLGTLGSLGLAWIFALSVLGIEPVRPRPLLYASIVLFVTSVLLIATGLLGELIKSLSPYSNDYTIRSMTSNGHPGRTARDHDAGPA